MLGHPAALAMPEPSEPFLLPPRFDDYEVVGALGRGGMGEVSLARDVSLDRPVAIKVLRASGPSAEASESLLREARALARLSHPNVVSVYRIGEVAGRAYVAYEYVAGQSLDRAPTPMPWPDVLHVAGQVARGLEAAHGAGLLHRDVKPANVILCADGRVKLIDFGLARSAHDPESRAEGAGAEEQGSGERRRLVGTPPYMAPELWRGEPASPRSDVYAFGLLLHELLAGAPAHAASDLEALRRRIEAEDLPSIATLRGDVPVELAALVARCVDRRPERRPRDGAEAREALDAIASGHAALGWMPESSWRGSGLASDEVAALQASFLRANVDRELTARLYAHLFARVPALRGLFPSTLEGQRRKLEQALHLAVGALRRPEELRPLLEALGARHAHVPIDPSTFALFRDALVDALRESDPAGWSDALESRWRAAIEAMNAQVVSGMESARRAGGAAGSSEPPRTRYADADGVSVAYQVFGQGPVDLLLVPGFISHVEAAWSLPEQAAWLHALGRLARVILVDKRGTGLSDRAGVHLPVEERMRDLPAVLDAVGSRRAVVFGVMDGSVTASAFAVAHPERVLGLVLYATGARLVADARYPHGIPPEVFEGACEAIRTAWGAPLFAERAAPSRASDPAFLAWWADFLRHGASPGAALELFRSNAEFDLAPLLPRIATPTLVAHRRGDGMMSLAGGLFVAQRIAGARWLALDGDDHLPYLGDTAPLLDAVAAFLAEVAPGRASRPGAASPRASESVREPSWVTLPLGADDD